MAVLLPRVRFEGVRARGFADFSPGFPALLSNLDVEGTRIGVLARRAGVTRQAAGQLLREIQRCGYVELVDAADDARATVVRFTAQGRRLLSTVLDLVEDIEARFAGELGADEFARVRDGLLQLANRLDPVGAFGTADEEGAGTPPAERPGTRRSARPVRKVRRASS
jgi:DNA-binding MarR family transcriptional regulator